MTLRAALLAACLPLPLWCQGAGNAATTNPYYTLPDDPDAQKLGMEKSAALCSGGFKGGEWDPPRSERKLYLKDNYVGESNVLEESLKSSSSADEVGAALEENTGVGWMLSKSGSIIFFFISFIAWFACSYTFCCRCCRCCAAERKTLLPVKIVCFALYVGVIGGIIISASIAMGGLGAVQDGFDNMACTSAKLLNETLNGKTVPRFQGFMPMLDEFHGIVQSLQPGSAFMTEVEDLIGRTNSIDHAVKMASETFGLLSVSLAAVDPALNAAGASVGHWCASCAEVSTALADVKTELDTSVATALVDARTEVSAQIQGDGAKTMADTMDTAAQPIVQIKDLLRSSLSGMVKEGIFEQGGDAISGFGMLGVLMIIIVTLLVSGCGCFGCFLWVGKEMGSSKAVDDGFITNPHRRTTYCCAACTWCCAFPLLWLVCWVSGLFVILTTVASSLCLIMDDLSGASVRSMGNGLGMNMSGEMNGTLLIVDKCFNPKDGDYSANLLDLITNANGTSMRDDVVEGSKNVILAQFDQISNRMGNQSEPMAANPKVLDMRRLLREEPVTTWIIPTQAAITQAPITTLAASQRSGLTDAPVTSLACVDHTPAQMADNTAIPGVNDIDTALLAMGSRACNQAPGGSCATYGYNGAQQGYYPCVRPVTCNGVDLSICNAANDFLGAKKILAEEKIFNCNLFEKNGATCDPLTPNTNCCTFQTIGGTQTCVINIKQRSCALAEFQTYVQNFDLRVKNVMESIDATQGSTATLINDGLRNAVTKTFIAAIDRFANGAGCGFLGLLYREMIDGLCYQGIFGLGKITEAYVGVLILVVMLIILSYALWRRVKDNYDNYKGEIVLS
jgi:hypothetical protein